MAFIGLTMDGTAYRVRIVYDTYMRAFQLMEGTNAAYMLSGRYERDLIGTAYTYEMRVEPDPRYPEDYDAFFDAISQPVPSHSITVFNGQDTMTYDAMIQSAQDTYKGILSGVHQWGNLTVRYIPIEPQMEVN